MKSNTFKYSVLAVGVVAAMSMATGANAATSGITETNTSITNQASAIYSIAGIEQPVAESNPVVVSVKEQVSFSLISNNQDDSSGNDSNINEEVAPNGFATFRHTLANTGNRSDSYTLSLENLSGDDSDYVLADSTVSYSLYNSGQVPGTDSPVSTQANILVSSANLQTFTLEKGQFVQFTINAKTNGNKGGNKQNLQLSATSSLIPSTATETLTNTNESITKLPNFSIVKTFTNGLDLNNTANDKAIYEVVIKNPANSYSTDATDIIITDSLPTGLIVASAVSASDITVDGNATKGTVASTANGFTVTGADLPVNGIITIVFTVKKDPNANLASGALNHVKVSDDLDNNLNTDNTIVDSTNTSDEKYVKEFYPEDDTDFTDGTVADGTSGNDSTQPLLAIDRKLTLTNATTQEIAPTTGSNGEGQVTHKTIITNTGKDAEGTNANPLTFTIANGDNAAVNPRTPVTIVYDPDGPANGSQPGQAITINPVDGVYTINNSVLTNGIAPDGTVTINYNVVSDKAIVGSTEKTVVTLIPKNEGAPTVDPVIDTTNVQGLKLEKFQALDIDCDGTISGTGEIDFTKDEITEAAPDQCVIYRIDAKNTSTAVPLGFNITGLTISDALSQFSAGADLVSGSASSSATTGSTIADPTVDNTSVSATASTLAPQGVATLKFRVKIKNNRTVTP